MFVNTGWEVGRAVCRQVGVCGRRLVTTILFPSISPFVRVCISRVAAEERVAASIWLGGCLTEGFSLLTLVRVLQRSAVQGRRVVGNSSGWCVESVGI